MTLLPNGWRIAPAGSHLDAGDLPLAMALHPDGRHLVITNNGWSKPSLRVVDLERRQVIQKMALDHAWLGLAWHPDGKRLFSSGAADNSIREVDWRGGKLVPGRTLVVAPPQTTKDERLMNAGFMGGLAVSGDGRVLYAAQVYGKAAVAVDLVTGAVLARRELPAEAYTARARARRARSSTCPSGAARGSPCSIPRRSRPLAEIPVGEHPNAMLFSKDAQRLFVACANTNAVWVVDLATRQASERIGVALSPKAPPGSTPNALALSPDGAHAARRERRQQHRRRRRRHAPGREPLPGLHPHRLVPHRRRVRPDGRERAGPLRQGPDPGGEPARPPAQRPRARTPPTSPAC